MHIKQLKYKLVGLLLVLGSSLPALAQSSGDGYNPANPAEPTDPATMLSYKVQVGLGTEGAGTVTGSGTYKYGTNVTIKATTNTGYKFLYWLKGDATEPYNTNAQFTYNVAVGDVKFTAVYEKLKNITVSVNNASAGTVTGGGLFATGGKATLNVTPTSNFCTFQHWIKNGASEPFSTQRSMTYVVENEDVEFCAVFECPPQVSVFVDDNTAGTATYTYNSNVVGKEPVNRTNTAGTETSTGYIYPFNNYSKYSTTQSIYTKAEVGGKGTIKSIAYYVGTAGSLSADVKIYMGHRSSASFSGNTDCAPVSGLTLVYDHSTTLGRATGWEKYTLDTPFEYDGTSNLVVVVTKSSSSTNLTLKYRYSSVSNACLYRANSSTTGYADASNTSNYSRTSSRPNAQFGIEYEKDVYGTARAATLTATPASNFRLAYWLRNDETEPYTTEPSFVYDLDEDVKFTAVFKLSPDNPTEPNTEAEKMVSYRVNVGINDAEAGVVSGGGKYLYGKKVTLSTSPNAGYEFRRWLKGSTEYSTSATTEYTVQNEDVDFTAVYEYVGIPEVPVTPTHKLYLLQGSEGCCTFSVSNGTSYDEGANYSVKAIPGTDFIFAGWYEGSTLVSSDPTYNGTMGEDNVLLTANCIYLPDSPMDPDAANDDEYADRRRRIRVLSVNEQRGTVKTTGITAGGIALAESDVILEAKPVVGYSFEGWSNGNEIVSTLNPYQFQVSEDVTLVAIFQAPLTTKLGDADNNGDVDITDITSVVSHIYGQTPIDFNERAADVNSDCEIDVTDISGIVTIIYDDNANEPMGIKAKAKAGAVISLPSMNLRAGSTQEIPIYISNLCNYSSVQFDVNLPNGIRVEKATFASDLTRGHDCMAEYVDDTYRIMGFSTSNRRFAETGEPAVVLTVCADENLEAGTYEMGISKGVVSAMGEKILPAAIGGMLTVDGTTAIQLAGSQQNDHEVYTLSGMRINSHHLTKGVYLINGKKYIQR